MADDIHQPTDADGVAQPPTEPIDTQASDDDGLPSVTSLDLNAYTDSDGILRMVMFGGPAPTATVLLEANLEGHLAITTGNVPTEDSAVYLDGLVELLELFVGLLRDERDDLVQHLDVQRAQDAAREADDDEDGDPDAA